MQGAARSNPAPPPSTPSSARSPCPRIVFLHTASAQKKKLSARHRVRGERSGAETRDPFISSQCPVTPPSFPPTSLNPTPHLPPLGRQSLVVAGAQPGLPSAAPAPARGSCSAASPKGACRTPGGRPPRPWRPWKAPRKLPAWAGGPAQPTRPVGIPFRVSAGGAAGHHNAAPGAEHGGGRPDARGFRGRRRRRRRRRGGQREGPPPLPRLRIPARGGTSCQYKQPPGGLVAAFATGPTPGAPRRVPQGAPPSRCGSRLTDARGGRRRCRAAER